MPITFPSHQGLLAPLWRCWPDRFAILALWCGAAAPDAIDGIRCVLRGSTFHQGFGHSLLGATVLGVPIGLALAAGLRALARRSARARWLLEVDRAGANRPGSQVLSAWIGSLSHLFFDLISHAHTHLFEPFARDPVWFGDWWTTTWAYWSVPGYPAYPIGPHFVVWVALSVVGAVMLWGWFPRARERAASTETG